MGPIIEARYHHLDKMYRYGRRFALKFALGQDPTFRMLFHVHRTLGQLARKAEAIMLLYGMPQFQPMLSVENEIAAIDFVSKSALSDEHLLYSDGMIRIAVIQFDSCEND